MDENHTESWSVLEKLCATQPLAVLATDAGGGPYASLVAIAADLDGRRSYFVTPRATRKWENLARNPQVALLLDDRSNTAADFSAGAAVTLLGVAEELAGEEKAAALTRFLERHPGLAHFASGPDCALFQVRASRAVLVTRLQVVTELLFD